MLIQIGFLLLSVGVYVSHADIDLSSRIENELFGELDSVFPDDFLSKFPENSEFFSLKILAYLFFNLFAKYFGENEPAKFWSKFNHNDFSRVAIDAAFYEYLTKFADRKAKPLVFDPLEDSVSNPEDIAVHRIGDYLDNLSAADQSETRSQATETKDDYRQDDKCSNVHVRAPTFGVPGQDFPDYCDIPDTSFTCADKPVPGIYADIETRCQVFHACWPNRIDSYLCPIGTTFNQARLTCDFWHESDCSLAPLIFDYSLLSAKGRTPQNADPTVDSRDETRTTSDSPAFAVTETDIPEYDETCQSLISKFQFHMTYLPVKCRFSVWQPMAPETTSKPRGKLIDRLMNEILSGGFRDAFEFKTKGDDHQELPASKLDSKVLKTASESTLKDGDLDATSIHQSTTELPSENEKDAFPPRKFVEKSTSQTKHGRSVMKSTLLKPSKPSEDTIRQVFDTMIMSLEAGGKLLNEGFLPLVEKVVLDHRRKKLASKS